MVIALVAIFFAGIANFAMHRAFMESDDPLIQQMVKPLSDKAGPHITYVFEFLLLVGAMAIAAAPVVVSVKAPRARVESFVPIRSPAPT